MRRYIEFEALMASYFVAYFLYGKVKYGSKGYSEERLGRMSAYKSLMQVYQPYLWQKERIKSEVILERFRYLEQKAEALPDDRFKRAFLETLAQAAPHHHLQEN
ncbi:hypothetical protein [Sulfurimonas sp. HSL3-7]|uniref:hypothetical protein n=1 Tax=Sulfonitrofixus jiaomeiensis TaxID=3131938 RepID=UPI0031F75842